MRELTELPLVLSVVELIFGLLLLALALKFSRVAGLKWYSGFVLTAILIIIKRLLELYISLPLSETIDFHARYINVMFIPLALKTFLIMGLIQAIAKYKVLKHYYEAI